MDKIKETLHNIGTKLCVRCTARTLGVNIFCYSFVCLHYVSVNALHTVLSNSSYEITTKWETFQILKENTLLVRIYLEYL